MNFESTKRPAIDDRPIDTLLAAYAARALTAPLDALVESHLEMKPDNRGYIAALEAAAGAFLTDIHPVPLTGRDRRLVNIFAMHDGEDHACPPSAADPPGAARPGLPSGLRRFVGCELSQLPWRTVTSGVEQAIVAEGAFGAASFLRCRPGKRLRMHGHTGPAAILVITGALADQQGRYEAGDVAVADGSCIHQPVVDSEGELICFMVSEDKVQTHGPIARMLEQIFGC